MRVFTKELAIIGLRESGKHVFLRLGGGPGCPKCSVFACRRSPRIPKARVFACFWGLRCSACRVFSCLLDPRSGPQSRGSRGRPGGRLEARKRPLLGLYGKTRGPRGPGAPHHGKNACDRGTLRASVGGLVFPRDYRALRAPPRIGVVRVWGRFRANLAGIAPWDAPQSVGEESVPTDSWGVRSPRPCGRAAFSAISHAFSRSGWHGRGSRNRHPGPWRGPGPLLGRSWPFLGRPWLFLGVPEPLLRAPGALLGAPGPPLGVPGRSCATPGRS